MREPEFPLNLHEECFTKVFPKEKLVYLTPHCKENLEEFNHDDVYIVGCMVDKVRNTNIYLKHFINETFEHTPLWISEVQETAHH